MEIDSPFAHKVIVNPLSHQQVVISGISMVTYVQGEHIISGYFVYLVLFVIIF